MRTSGIILLTFREMWANKVVLGLFLVATLCWLMLAFAMNLDIVDGALVGMRIFGQASEATETLRDPDSGEIVREALSLDKLVVAVESFVAGAAYWIGTLLALFATAPLLNGLLERGRIDLLLSKPISRPRLIAAHIAGVWMTMLFLAVYLIGMVWVVMSIKSQIWNSLFLWSIPVLVGMFAVMYGVVAFINVWTQSTGLSLIVAYGLIFASIILAAKDQLAPQIRPPWRQVFLGFYHVAPHFAEVTGTVSQLAGATPVQQWYPLAASLFIGMLLYTGAFIRFIRRDF